jgi:hypothetical protein
VPPITTDHPFLAKHQDKISGVLSCFDRVIFRGHLPLSYEKGLSGFLYQQKVLLKDFKGYAPQIADRVRDHVKAIVEKAGAPFRHLRLKEPMEEIARQMAREKKITEGIVCGFSQLETCRTFRFEYAGMPRLRGDYRVCSVLYVFLVHPVLGLIHVKIQTWFPLTMQVYVNGHDYLAKKLDELGVKYSLYDNCFTWIADMKVAQKCADRFAKLKWEKLLGRLARQFNPLLGKEMLGGKYYWVADQAEYATDVLFRDATSLAGLYPRLLEHAGACLSTEDVLRFLGRKPHPRNFKAEVQTHVTRRVEGVRVVHRLKSNKLKMYDKGGLVLRIETTINNPREFCVWRKTRGGKGMSWQFLPKGVAWLWRYADVSRSSNGRYLETMAVVDDDSKARRLLDRATKPAELDGRRKRALQPLSPADQELFMAVMRGEHRLKGFRNQDIAEKLYPKKTKDTSERRRRCGRVTRLIQLLRAHRLVAKIPRARRYRITQNGELLMSAAIKTKEQYLPMELHEVA